MKKYPLIVAFGILVVLAVFFGFCASSSSNSGEEVEAVVETDCKETIKEDKPYAHFVKSPYIPETVEFAGEALPIHLFDVRESLERELIVNMNFHSSTTQYLKRITRFFPVIEPILAARGIPDDFKYLSLIESDFMNRVSPKGASGFWQFMKGAAAEYGLEMNAEIDERYHLEKATVAACRYLNDSYKTFGNWALVAASYNMGRAGLSAQMRNQQCKNYYDLWLNEETSRYVFRIAAVKLILTDPQRYGFHVLEEEQYQPIPYTEVEIKTGVPDFVEFAFQHNTNYKMIRYLNPWLRDSKLTNPSKKTYMIRIPAEGFRDVNYNQ